MIVQRPEVLALKNEEKKMEDTILEANTNEEITIDLKKYFALFWQWAWLIILAGLLAGVTAFFVSHQMTLVFEATTTVLVISE